MGKFKPNPEVARQHVKDALDLLKVGVETLTTPAGFAAHLQGIVRGNFLHYSANNRLLVLIQCPHATEVGGYHYWAKQGRKPLAGKGIRILAPAIFTKTVETENDQTGETTEETLTIRRFKTIVVWDVSQTDGPELPEPEPEPTTAPTTEQGALPFSVGQGADIEALQLDYDLCAALKRIWGCPVDDADLSGAYGRFFTKQNRIEIDRRHDAVTNCATVAHEGAHCVVHHVPALAGGGYAVEEQVAEGAAFCVLARVGLRTDRFTFAYIKQYGGNAKSIIALADRIAKTALALIDGAGLDAAARDDNAA